MNIRLQIVGYGKPTWRHTAIMWWFHVIVWCVRHNLPCLPMRYARVLMTDGDEFVFYIDGRRVFGPRVA